MDGNACEWNLRLLTIRLRLKLLHWDLQFAALCREPLRSSRSGGRQTAALFLSALRMLCIFSLRLSAESRYVSSRSGGRQTAALFLSALRMLCIFSLRLSAESRYEAPVAAVGRPPHSSLVHSECFASSVCGSLPRAATKLKEISSTSETHTTVGPCER